MKMLGSNQGEELRSQKLSKMCSRVKLKSGLDVNISSHLLRLCASVCVCVQGTHLFK